MMQFRQQRYAGRAGFTLLEFLIAFAIFIIIGTATAFFLRDFLSLSLLFETSFLTEREIESTMKNMLNELRETTQSSVGSYPIERAEDNAIAFYTNIDKDPLMERVHYFLNGTELKKSVVKPVGQPLTYSTTTAQESLSTVLRDVAVTQSLPMFSYRGAFATTTPATTSPLYLQDIRLVIVRLNVDKDPAIPPPAITVLSVVNLRNLKTY